MAFEFEEQETVACESDVASRTEAQMLAEALQKQKDKAAAAKIMPRADGKCKWCIDDDAPLLSDSAFCSPHCDEDYHKDVRAKQQRA